MSDDDYVHHEDGDGRLSEAELAAKRQLASRVGVCGAVGNLLADGGRVTLVKDFDVKGAGQTLKRSTFVKSITRAGDQEVDCRYEETKGLVLHAEFTRKR